MSELRRGCRTLLVVLWAVGVLGWDAPFLSAGLGTAPCTALLTTQRVGGRQWARPPLLLAPALAPLWAFEALSWEFPQADMRGSAAIRAIVHGDMPSNRDISSPVLRGGALHHRQHCLGRTVARCSLLSLIHI